MRSPEEIIGADAVLQLIFEGYAIVPAGDQTEPELFDDGPGFPELWAAFPHKVSKPSALRAYKAARKRGVPHKTMMDGMQQYVVNKPPDRPWMMLSTFINNERWNDRPAPVAQPARGIAGVRQRLAQEIENGSAPQFGSQGAAGRLSVGLPLAGQRR